MVWFKKGYLVLPGHKIVFSTAGACDGSDPNHKVVTER